MSTFDEVDPDQGDPERPHRLVCGLCHAVLDGTHPDRASADQAADEHAAGVHPEHPSVVVLAVPVALLEDHEADALAFAASAQRRVSARGDNGRDP